MEFLVHMKGGHVKIMTSEQVRKAVCNDLVNSLYRMVGSKIELVFFEKWSDHIDWVDIYSTYNVRLTTLKPPEPHTADWWDMIEKEGELYACI